MVNKFEEMDGYQVTQLKVLQSAAGYYIGRQYYDEEMNGMFPYNRVGGYFKTRKAAQDHLDHINRNSPK